MRWTVPLALLAALGGCAQNPGLASGPGAHVTAMKDLPAPDGADPSAPSPPYRVAAYDKLAITVAGLPELTGKFGTDSNGRFTLPYAGEIDALGRTPAELVRVITARLDGAYVKHPQVAVNVEDATSLAITVDGQVGQPGNYPMIANMTLMRAVAAAKGLGEFARVDDVVVFRTVNGTPMAAVYNLGAIRRGAYGDPRMFPGDVVVVGDSAARRRFQQILQILPVLTTPIVLTLERL